MLKGKKIILGITGSIAAYKACYIIRGLIKQGAEVQVVITPAGKEFITPITLSALTSKPVISEFFAQRDGTWNGQWNSRQYAHNNLTFGKSSRVCCSGNGPRYVCPSRHPEKSGYTAFLR